MIDRLAPDAPAPEQEPATRDADATSEPPTPFGRRIDCTQKVVAAPAGVTSRGMGRTRGERAAGDEGRGRARR